MTAYEFQEPLEDNDATRCGLLSPGSIDVAYARLMAVLPPGWVLSSISLNSTYGYDVSVMSHDRLRAGDPWRMTGTGASIVEAMMVTVARLQSFV
jgi:hypothetical protein